MFSTMARSPKGDGLVLHNLDEVHIDKEFEMLLVNLLA